MNRFLSAMLAACGLFTSASASAHGVDENRAFVRLAGDTAYVVITPPAEAFPEYDANQDGHLDAKEVRASRYSLLSTMQRMLSLRDQAGRTAEPTRL